MQDLKLPLYHGKHPLAAFQDGGECVMETQPIPWASFRVVSCGQHVQGGSGVVTWGDLPDTLERDATVKAAVKATGRTVVHAFLIVVMIEGDQPPGLAGSSPQVDE